MRHEYGSSFPPCPPAPLPSELNLGAGEARYSELCQHRGPARSAEWVGGSLRPARSAEWVGGSLRPARSAEWVGGSLRPARSAEWADGWVGLSARRGARNGRMAGSGASHQSLPTAHHLP